MRPLFIFIWLAIFTPTGILSQEVALGEPDFSTVLTIDISRIARDTLFGQRVIKDFENAQNELVEDNTIIQNDLEAEEQSLVELRKTLEANQFRKLAVEFDEKANSIRKERAELENTLFQKRDESISELLKLSVPYLQEIMLTYRASIILDRRNIVLSNPMTDVTDQAIQLINENLGDGQKKYRLTQMSVKVWFNLNKDRYISQ
jgi:Skp family chaperone for outer membrane proteins